MVCCSLIRWPRWECPNGSSEYISTLSLRRNGHWKYCKSLTICLWPTPPLAAYNAFANRDLSAFFSASPIMDKILVRFLLLFRAAPPDGFFSYHCGFHHPRVSIFIITLSLRSDDRSMIRHGSVAIVVPLDLYVCLKSFYAFVIRRHCKNTLQSCEKMCLVPLLRDHR